MTSAVEDVASTDTDMSSATGSSNASSPAQPDERKTSVPGDGESDEEGEVSSSEDENASSNKGPAARQAGQKRPADESSPTSTSLRADADVAAAVNKRVKLTPLHDALQTGDWRTDYRDQEGRLLKDFSKLPAQIWTHIFTYAPPSTLADLSKISRGFRNLLVSTGPVDTSSGPPVTGGVLKPLAPDSVWALSRKLYYPSMPVPLEKQSEFDMWNLLERRKCQFCGKSGQDASEASPGLPWEPALGDDGVKIIWPFGVRSCGACLVKHSEKEMQLMISSSTPLMLLPALPFIFLTPDLHVITPKNLQDATSAPPPQMTKYFLKSHIEDIKVRLEEVKSLGPAAAEEWFKGLETQGRDQVGHAGRWEHWYVNGGRKALRWRPQRDVNGTSRKELLMQEENKSDGIGSEEVKQATSIIGPQSDDHGDVGIPSRSHLPNGQSDPPHRDLTVGGPPRASDSSNQNDSAHPPPGSLRKGRLDRSANEVSELKAMRRAEIERRCSELVPPITPHLLNHMDSFRNALQISMPLTDSQWEVLKPLLVSQRDLARQKEDERLAQGAITQVKLEERRDQEVRTKEAKEIQDKEWDEAQDPIRHRLAGFADEYIAKQWADGDRITKDNCSKFAAEVLIHVRKRFYHEIAREDAECHAAGSPPKRDPPGAPPTRKLILENMKWLFDFKIKALTERYRKELFLCHGCDNPTKFYGFEGVIQHFAAKHTNALSQGNIVVHWKGAEWPEHPPFHPDPNAAHKAAVQWASRPAPMGFPGASGPPPSGYGQGGPFPPGPPVGPPMHPHGDASRLTQYSPGPYNQSGYGEAYGGPPPSMYPPPPPPPPPNFPGPVAGYPANGPNYQPGGPGGYGHGHGPQPGYHGSGSGFDGIPSPYQPHASHAFASPHPSQAFPAPMAGHPPPVPPYGQPNQMPNQHPGPPPPVPFGSPYPPYGGPYGPPQGHPPGPLPGSASMPSPSGAHYQMELDEMAGIARELWATTSGIKDLSSGIRAHVIIQQTVERFTAKLSRDLRLDMFMHGLESHNKMNPINNLRGLLCKACHLSRNKSGGGSHSHPPRFPSGDKKPYDLRGLLKHFKGAHMDRPTGSGHYMGNSSPSRLDWRVDMVELPEAAAIQGLAVAQGMDDAKLQVIARVFPTLFPPPPHGGLPHVSGSGPGPYKGEKMAHQSSRGFEGGGSRGGRGPRNSDRPQRESFREADPSYPRSPEYHPVEVSNRRLVVDGMPRPDYIARYHDGHEFQDKPPKHQAGNRDARRSGDRRYEGRSADRNRAGPPPDYGQRQGPGHPDSMLIDERGPPPDGEHRYANGRRTMYERGDAAGDRDRGREPSRRAGKPTLSEGDERRKIKQEAADEGSEDGELGEGGSRGNVSVDLRTGPTEALSAANQFLDNIPPPHGKNEPEAHLGVVVDERPGAETRTGRSSLRESPEPLAGLAPGPGDVRRRASMEPATRYYDEPPSGRYTRSPSRLMPASQAGHPADERYAPNAAAQHKNVSTTEQLRRPRSRYDRYEHVRHERNPARSRSPPRGGVARPDEPVIRERSPGGRAPRYEHVYGSRSPIIMRTSRTSEDERRGYVPGPATEHFVTYADGRGPAEYEPVYGEHMEYVPVRRITSPTQRGAGPYVVRDRPGHEGVVEYPAAEEGVRETFIQEGGRLYRLEDRSRHADDPRGPAPPPQLRY